MAKDPSAKPQVLSRASVERLSAMLAWFEQSEFYQAARKPLRGPRAKSETQLAIAQEDIAKGASGDVKFRVGADKGSETTRDDVYQAFNRRFPMVPDGAEVELRWVGGGWEVAGVVFQECIDMSDPSEITGWDPSKTQFLAHVAGTLNEETEEYEGACLRWIDADEDCL